MEDSDDLARVAQYLAVTEEDEMFPRDEICKKITKMSEESHQNTLKLLMKFTEC